MRMWIVTAAIPLVVHAGPGFAAQTASKAGHVFSDCRACPQMVVIPAGSFLMGAPDEEKGADPIERPVHRVNVPAFAAGRFDVTRGEYAAFAKATGKSPHKGCSWTPRVKDELDPKASWADPGFRQTDRSPVVCVTWNEAEDYASWLSKRTGHHYRLLSEAEWEYAARAGTTTPYYWGLIADRDHVNYGREHGWGKGVAKDHDRWVYTSPVGSFPPNRFGLYDMSGNVLQYVQDCLALSYQGTPTDGSAYGRNIPLRASGDLAPLDGKMSCSFRIARGGDWADPPEQFRSAFRNFAPAPGRTLDTDRSAGGGFRVARDLNR